MGRPEPRDLPRLARIREDHWAAGQVAFLSAQAGRRALTEEWDVVAPEALSLGI